MAKLILDTHKVYDFSALPNPLHVGKQPHSGLTQYNEHPDPVVGTMRYSNMAFPFMHIIDMKWKTLRDMTLNYAIPTDTVNFSFHLNGNTVTSYRSVDQRYEAAAGTNYFIHTPEDGFRNEFKENESIEVFHISLDKQFFAGSIACNDQWSETLIDKISRGQSFTGSNRIMQTTPGMLHLIQQLRTNAAQGAVANFTRQAQVLELISLQMEQAQSFLNGTKGIDMKPEDVKKLQQLKEYLDAHFLSELSLAQLSRLCLLNEFKLKRGFKLLYGDTVFGYIRKRKMEHAVQLLKAGMSMADVAGVLGYEHAHHFVSAFKAYWE